MCAKTVSRESFLEHVRFMMNHSLVAFADARDLHRGELDTTDPAQI